MCGRLRSIKASVSAERNRRIPRCSLRDSSVLRFLLLLLLLPKESVSLLTIPIKNPNRINPIWIAADKEVRGVDPTARSLQMKRDNFERILSFLASQKVRTSTVTSRDLASGNLKSLMRLILALASHYKPYSVEKGQQRSSNQSNNRIYSTASTNSFDSFESNSEIDRQRLAEWSISIVNSSVAVYCCSFVFTHNQYQINSIIFNLISIMFDFWFSFSHIWLISSNWQSGFAQSMPQLRLIGLNQHLN